MSTKTGTYEKALVILASRLASLKEDGYVSESFLAGFKTAMRVIEREIAYEKSDKLNNPINPSPLHG